LSAFDDGAALMLAFMEHCLEGVVSKKRNAPYRSGRGPTWVKSKTPMWR
jgi:bifunctional non-homologous end joining protein LigD